VRGYVSFVLVLLSVLIILFLIDAHNSSSFEFSKQIAIEKAYQTQMNVKETIFEAGLYGAKEGISSYLIEHRDVDLQELRKAARKGAHERIKLLENHGYGNDVEIWCGYISSSDMRKTINRMGNEKKAALCQDCRKISSEECLEFIQVEIDPVEMSFELYFQGEDPAPGKSGIVGISVYDEKHDIGVVGHMPQTEKVIS